MIADLKKRAGYFSSGTNQPKQQQEYGGQGPEAHLQTTPYAGAAGSSNADSEQKYRELHQYIESLGLDKNVAAQIASSGVIASLVSSMQEISVSQASLADVEVQLTNIKVQMQAAGIDALAADDFIGRIKQAKESKDEAMLVAFLKNQVETAINHAIMQQIALNPQLYYLIPALSGYSEREKIERLANDLAYLQQVLTNQRAISFAINAGAVSDIAVILKLGEKLNFHMDNIQTAMSQTNPEIVEKVAVLENSIKAIASNPTASPELANAISVERKVIRVDAEQLFHEAAKLSPSDAATLNDIARQITQVFGEAQIQHQTLVQVASDAHIKGQDASLKGVPVHGAEVTFEAHTHKRVEHISPEVQAAATTAVAADAGKIVEVDNIKKAVNEAVSFDVNLRHSIEQAAQLVGQGMRDAGFMDNQFKMGEYRADTKSIAVEASLEQAMNLANNFKHQNLAHHHEPHKHGAGKGV